MKGRFARWCVSNKMPKTDICKQCQRIMFTVDETFFGDENEVSDQTSHTCEKPVTSLRSIWESTATSWHHIKYIYIFIYLSKRNKSWVHIQVVSSLKDGFLFVSRIHRVGIRGRFLSGKLMMSCRRSAAPCRLGIECVIKHGGPLGIGRDLLTVQPVQTKINQVWLPDGKPINKHEPLGIIPLELVWWTKKLLCIQSPTNSYWFD